MNPETVRRPRVLTIVAWLFIVSGALAIVGVAIDLLVHTKITLDISVLDFWIGRWLLRLRPRGYVWAHNMLVLEFVLAPLGLLLLIGNNPVPARVFGFPVGEAPRPFAFGFFVILIAIAVWQYRMLRQPDIRALFGYSTPLGQVPGERG